MTFRVLIFCLFFGVSAYGQATGVASENSLPFGLEESLRRGDVSGVGSYINTTVELILPESRGVYERPHAVQILKKFFADNTLLDFNIPYRMPRGNGFYAIGRMYTHKGNYRLIMWLKQTDGRLTIHQLRIEEDND